jgi:UDP:flavonoid glycosyltransferase YjiC (YdhE family)
MGDMARICFTWELGQGYGHLVRYRTFIARLLERGHDVSFIAKDAARARTVFAGMAVSVLPIEPGSTPSSECLVTLNSYPEILHDFGFRRPEYLHRQLEPWLHALRRLQPDVVIADHSPTAFVAARILAVRVISSGNGFTVPPRVTPMPPLRYWSGRGREHLVNIEQIVLETCNTVLREHGTEPLATVTELFATDGEWILSFPELDHYGVREGVHYLGSFSAEGFGAPPRWQAVDGPKLFAYLSIATLSPELIAAIGSANANLCIHAPQLSPGEFAKLAPERTVVEAAPVDLARVAGIADAVITNGSLNSVSGFLAAGVPQLALPNNLERHMVGRRLELTGGGLMAPWHKPARLPEKLRAVIRDRAFRRGAERFAARYSEASAAQQCERMIADLARVLVI